MCGAKSPSGGTARTPWLAGTVSLFALVLSVPAAPSDAGTLPVEVTFCGQVYAGDGYLTADLDCTGFRDVVVIDDDSSIDGVAVGITGRRRGSLDLRGYTLTAGRWGVFCTNSCRIFGGGGSIPASSPFGAHGIHASRNLDVYDVTVSGHGQVGLNVSGRLRFVDSVIANNGSEGIRTRSATLRDSIVTGNQQEGILARSIRLRDSSVTGNGIFGACTQQCGGVCVDLHSHRKPRLRNLTCETSHNESRGGCATWGVCQND